jgi:aspartokinase
MTEGPRVATAIKVGGSLLRDAADYRLIASRLRPWVDRGAWVVVSAAHGVTDELERLADDRRPEAVPEIVSRHARLAGASFPASLASELVTSVRDTSVPAATIVSWGERASAAALQSHLSRIGIHVPVAELPWSGLPPFRGATLVPGFYVRGPGRRVQLLSRGGSDISAVLLAARLHAPEVRLWKNGGGIRGATDGMSTMPEIGGLDLLARLGDAIRPLHPSALRLALRESIELILEDPTGGWPSTRILPGPSGGPTTGPSERPLEEHAHGVAPSLDLVRS